MALLKVFAHHASAKSGLKRWPGIWRVMPVLLLLGVMESSAQAVTSPEYQVKAVFLFNFAQFVAWPSEAFPQTQTPLVIGVLGDDPFGTYLDETVRGERVNNRPMVVQRYRRLEEVRTCHVLFISESETSRLEQSLSRLKGRHILTVGEADGFALVGGVIQFVTEKNKIRLKINLEAAKAAGLTISSKLLRPAEIVGGG